MPKSCSAIRCNVWVIVRTAQPLFITFVIQWMAISEKAGPNYVLSAGRLIGEQTQIEGKERKRSADIYMSAPRTFQWNITVNLPEGVQSGSRRSKKLNVKVENECGAFIAKAVTENGKLILNILKRYNHKTEPAANWEKLLQIQDASKAYEALSVVLKK